jgi:hypothetical protein
MIHIESESAISFLAAFNSQRQRIYRQKYGVLVAVAEDFLYFISSRKHRETTATLHFVHTLA